ncbi:MAG: tripartite tricarboxylate transporter substrate binding protein, partial [Polaromonas sp.]
MNVKSTGALSRRQALLLSAGTAASLVAPAVLAQGPSATSVTSAAYPDRAVKIVVPFAPGAGTDAMARLIAQKLGEVMNANFVVDNR